MVQSNESTTLPSVMIIDDDPTIRLQAYGFLSQSGFNVTQASDGISALEKIDEVRPDLILLDVEMPGLNGFEVCASIRSKAEFASTPILMLTGLDDKKSIDKSYNAGATDFATKPVNWSLLRHRLRYIHRASIESIQLLREQASLDSAQRLAQLGNWQYDCVSGQTQWSKQLFHIFDLCPGRDALTKDLLLRFIHPDDENRVKNWFNNAHTLTYSTSIDHQIELDNGCVRYVRQQVEPELDSDGNIIRLQGTVQDFTERRQVEKKVHQLAYYDTLTKLPNRQLFSEKLDYAMQIAQEHEQKIGVLYFDLDDFKRINDTFGHAVGDKLLHEVARRLQHNLRIGSSRQSNDIENTVARMSGDEFTIILHDIKSPAEAESVAARLIDVVSQPFSFDGLKLFTSPSIGIALYPHHGDCAEILLRNADMAMYNAKRFGKKVYKTHSEESDEKHQRRYDLDTRMRVARDKNEFCVYYQPQLDLKSGTLYAAEALIRWKNEDYGMISPVEFIPIAEDNGMIIEIGEWVLRMACQQAQRWRESGFSMNNIAVNVSAVQFMRSDLPDQVQSALDESGLPAQHLELEITESVLASDTAHAIDTLTRLNTIGVKLSIDDFGTGYSSLSQLKNFPIDRLKIDQSFIRNVCENNDDAAITRAVIAMSKNMNIRVLAEGVETQAHLEFLQQAGCDEIQGYHISRPQSAEQLTQNMQQLVEETNTKVDELPPTLKIAC